SHRVHRPGDQRPGRVARGLPAHELPYGRCGRRVRHDGRARYARGPARRDRRGDRGRVRPSRRIGRARGRQDRPDRRNLPNRRLQREVWNRAADRGLPHGCRLRVRPARTRRRGRRRGRVQRPSVPGARNRGVADRKARGAIHRASGPATRGRSARRARGGGRLTVNTNRSSASYIRMLVPAIVPRLQGSQMLRLKLSTGVILAALIAVLAVTPMAVARMHTATAAKTITVKASEFKFVLSTKTARHGAFIFKVTNKGKIVHDFKIAGKKTPKLSPGK